MQHAWSILGIAPTSDAVAIKRSYAQRLKHARPDDDAHAYQQLRDAYDWALNWARWQREQAGRADAEADAAATDAKAQDADGDDDYDDDPRANLAAHNIASAAAAAPAAQDAVEPPAAAPGAEPVAANAPLEPPAAQAATDAPSDDGFGDEVERAPAQPPAADAEPQADDEWTPPAELARSLFAHWQQHGDEALVAAWPRLHHELDRLPLALRGEASVWFAELVLQNPSVPAAMIARLADYFDWDRDFRSAQQLGSARAHALEQRILEAGARPVRDEQTRQRYADLMNLHRLLAAGLRWRARVFATLAEPAMTAQAGAADEALWRMLQIPPAGRDALQATIRAGLAARAALCMLLVGIVYAQFHHSSAAGLLFGIGACGGVLALGVIGRHIPAALFDMAWEWLQGTVPRALTPAKKPRYLLVATTLGVVGVGVAQVMLDPTRSSAEAGEFSAICAVVALLLLWPRGADWRSIVPLLFCMLCVAIATASATLPSPLAIGLATAWTLLTLWLFDARHAEIAALYRRPSALLPSTPFGWIWFALCIKLVLGFVVFAIVLLTPTTVLLQAARRGATFAVASLSIAFALWALLRDEGEGPLLLALMVIVPPLLNLLQTGTAAIARSRMLQAPLMDR